MSKMELLSSQSGAGFLLDTTGMGCCKFWKFLGKTEVTHLFHPINTESWGRTNQEPNYALYFCT